MRSICFKKVTLAVATVLASAMGVCAQTASFTGFDTTTKGSWVGAYGGDGFVIANGTDAHPAYSTISFKGANTWTWLSPSPDPRALYSAPSTSSTRISSTYYSLTSFDIDLNVNGLTQIALYCVDLDTTTRNQTISILNASTNAVLDTRTLTNFSGGTWAVWNISGNVIIRVTNNSGSIDSVVSGVFFKSMVTVPPPTVTMNTPSQPITGVAALSAVANANSPATIASVQFQADGKNIGSPVTSGSGSTYSVQWTNPTNGSHSLTAIATDSDGQSTTSAPVQVIVSLTAPLGPTATFVKFDTTTKGGWVGTYGADGYIIANDANVAPSYLTETTSGAQTYTWASGTTDVRALLVSPSTTSRIASTFFSSASFSFDLNPSDTLTHQVALYGLDYETNTRSQTVTITDPSTNTVLNTQTMSQMNGGVYAVWTYSGHVLVTVTYTGGLNAVVGGLFFGGAGTTTVNPPTVTITAPAGGTVTGTVSVTANATSSIGVASVQYYLDGTALGSSTSGPSYSYPWNTTAATNAQHTLTATATDTQGQTSVPSAGVVVTVSNPVTTPPPTISITSPSAGTVTNSVTLTATASASSPATMQSVQFKVDSTSIATISGAGPYTTPWNSATVANGSHVISAIATDSLGHTTTVTVAVTVSNVTTSSQATFVKSDTQTAGNWIGVYGGDGYIIANSTSAAPGYATVVPSASAQTYTWASGISDPRALFTNSNKTSRIASTYFTSATFSFDVNLTDGQPHQVALYSLDYETNQRAQTIAINDSASGKTLSSVSLSSFNSGVWSVWSITGHVVIQVTYVGGFNAVVSGLFFGSSTVTPLPTITLNTPAQNATVSGTVNVTSTPVSSIGIASVQYYLDGTALGGAVTTGPSYTYAWDTTTATNNAQHTLTAIATDTLGQKSAASAGVTVTVANTVTNPPSISISSPTSGAVVSGAVTIQATASAVSPATVTSVTFSADSTPLGTVTGAGPNFSTPWNTNNGSYPNGSHVITATVTDSNGHTKSATVTVTVNNPIVSANTAEFVKADTTTQGNWVGVYGADGYSIANDTPALPGDVTLNITGSPNTWTWFASTTDPRATYTDKSASNRIASTFFTTTSETFDITFGDSDIHQLAVYCVDFDTTGRTQTMQIVDAKTGTVLDTETVASFNSGIWEVWNVTGHVQLVVTNTNSLTSAVSGLFFRDLKALAHPTVSFNSPSNNATLEGPAKFSVNATSPQGISSVQFQVDGVNTGAPVTGAGPAYVSYWASPLATNGSHTISAVVEDNMGLLTTVSVPVTVSNGPAPTTSAALTYVDQYTSGSWKGVYGQDGEIMASDANNPPFYAVVNFIGTDVWIWHGGDPTTDVPGLQRLNSNVRIGAVFENPVPTATFTIDVNFVDYQQHEFALYAADWHHNVRVQDLTVTDAVTNKVLDTEVMTNFSLGVWYVWNITGHVIITVTLDQVNSLGAPDSAITAAVFFEPPSIAARPTIAIQGASTGQTVTKTLSLQANASGPLGVTSVQWEVDGWPVGAPVTTPPYTFNWDSTTVADGLHQINAYAVDSSNHAATSAPVSVQVAN